jgi:hypothetical protein
MASLVISTPWQPGGPEGLADETKHNLFASMALDMMCERFPWLPALLEAAQAKVIACEGHLLVEAPAGSQRWVDIAEVGANLCMVPWAEPDEVPN